MNQNPFNSDGEMVKTTTSSSGHPLSRFMYLKPSIYSLLIDPRFAVIREKINILIPHNSRVIDIACGTGALSMHLALSGHRVVGVDSSPSMIHYAGMKARESGYTNVLFMRIDASELSVFKDKDFDYSIMSLALHQFSPVMRELVLKEAVRISERLIIADYAHPQPEDFYGKTIRIIERIAGKKHYSCFRSYLKAGGIKGIAIGNGLSVISLNNYGKGILTLGELRVKSTNSHLFPSTANPFS